jgi:class 3 adenylate cyclase
MSEKRKIKVLWVDDDANYLLSPLQRRLEREGFSLSTAADPQTATEFLKAQKFDVLLLDVILAGREPGRLASTGGLDLVEYLQGTVNADTPVVGLSVIAVEELGTERELFASYFDKLTLLDPGVLERLVASLKHGGRPAESAVAAVKDPVRDRDALTEPANQTDLLSESSRLKPVAGSPRVQVIVLFVDLRGSTHWAHDVIERDFKYVRDFLEALREWLLGQISTARESQPDLIKFLGDGFLFVWEIPDNFVVPGANAIVELANKLCTDYRSWIRQEDFLERFPWGVPLGLGYGIDVGPAIRLTFENGSDDYLGAPLNIAAKMQDLAQPHGGGLIRASVWSRLKEELQQKFPKEGVMKIEDRAVDLRMTEEVE